MRDDDLGRDGGTPPGGWRGYVVRIRYGYLTRQGQIGVFGQAWVFSNHEKASEWTNYGRRGAVWSYLRAEREEAERSR